MNQMIRIAHLYPREMNIYGDMGNIITLKRRLEWRGFRVQVDAVEVGDAYDFAKADVVFGGGGQDSGQLVVGKDLLRHGAQLRQLADEGLPMLVICGLYQLFGKEFVTNEHGVIEGIGVFDARTKASNVRMIGNVVVESEFGQLVGFENHSGQTVLDKRQQSLGRVVKGYGNTPKGGQEGAMRGAAIGTYLHGPLLPKNPALADEILTRALARRYGIHELAPLDDSLELAAAVVAVGRPQ